VLADCRAIIKRGSAILQSTPITPQTNMRSISAKPWSFRIVTESAQSQQCRARADCGSLIKLLCYQ